MSHAARNPLKAHLIGGGIASLAAAAILIRDGDVRGIDITIYEELPWLGGSLDGTGSAERGYVLRGGRMLESKYLCTYNLFDSIPTLDKTKTVTEEIFEWNKVIHTSSKSRLVRAAEPIDRPKFNLAEHHIFALEKLVIEPESMLGDSSIADHFDDAFFETNFWLMWCTTFAFQPWHSAVEFKRYLLRFAHMINGFSQLQGIMRTVYNQNESMILPLRRWLEERGVTFELNTEVVDLGFSPTEDGEAVCAIYCRKEGWPMRVPVARGDVVIATLGSMTEASDIGSMDKAPATHHCQKSGSWALWKSIARGRPALGKPDAFAGHIDDSKWISFTVTTKSPELFRHIRDLTGNVPGEGGLITFADSRWLLSIVLPHQPHFRNQPADVQVLWGYALNVDAPGDFVDKAMSACTGREILTELLGHLGFQDEKQEIIDRSICLPCMMPYITSQFLRRKKGDRPDILPKGYSNLAIVGQFCEQPEDVVFTVEYSIRSAMSAVYGLLGLKKTPPPVYKGLFNPWQFYVAQLALHDKIA